MKWQNKHDSYYSLHEAKFILPFPTTKVMILILHSNIEILTIYPTEA